MRLFIAIDLPDPIKARLSALQTSIPTARWVKPAHMHLTVRFLGDTERGEIARDALATVRAAPFTLQVAGVGQFPPGERKPARVLWAGVAPDAGLTALHRAVEWALVEAGFAPELRPFSPHLTLARLKLDRPHPAVAAFLTRHRGFEAEPFEVTQFTLYASDLRPGGPQYTAQGTYPLA